MTEGSLRRHLLSAAVPMILGNLLQLTYNAADAMILSRYVGEEALAAVSTANPVMTIVILGVSGLSMGGSVLMSRFFGAGDERATRREFSTLFLFSLMLSAAVLLVGMLLSSQILGWIRTPREVLGLARDYLHIVFVGFLFTFQYNIMAAALRAVGDARAPVIFLGLACILNIALDWLLVKVFGLGVRGAGWATVAAQAVSAGGCTLYIRRRVPLLRLGRGDWKIDADMLKETLRIGSLTALQQAALPIGKVFVQSAINAQGVAAIGAFNAVCRVDDFAIVPAQSIGSATMTCTAQNRGARSRSRVVGSFRHGLTLGLCYYPVILALTFLLRPFTVRLLTPDGSDEMRRMAVAYLGVKAWMYVFPCVLNPIQGFLRGLSHMRTVLFSTVFQMTIRAVLSHVFVPRLGIVGEAWACLIGWSAMFVFEYGWYFFNRRKLLDGIGEIPA